MLNNRLLGRCARKNLDKNMQAKIDSYLNAKIRTLTEKDPMRASIQRAMMDINFVLKWDGKVIKPAGELLTLTAAEAEQKHKEKPLLSEGTFETEDQLVQFLDSKEYKTLYLTNNTKRRVVMVSKVKNGYIFVLNENNKNKTKASFIPDSVILRIDSF